ncbi:PACE efflux transporter [uncultured Shimia sp.]|uniref:PACE efflux transporter n=1 Tax=uncultured Shimia sp. TaxID=573152 RepID=UPI002631775B|nr:PACE efflux transporter [uncultured Shimia sp.]
MRTVKDRLRHTIMFEGIALGVVATGGAWLTGHSMAEIGSLGVMFSLLAMAWNFVFNWLFDHWDLKYRDMAPRGPGIRVVHAVLFEAFLVTVGIFLTAWWLTIGYWEAFLLDLGFSAFFLVYAYVFNWTYDVVFPAPRSVPEAQI